MMESNKAILLLVEMVEFVRDLQECVDDWNFPILTHHRIQSLLKRYDELAINDPLEDSKGSLE